MDWPNGSDDPDPGPPPDLVAVARAAAAAELPDLTLGGYLAEHLRPPAFLGIDGQPYSVDVDVEETGDPDRPFVAFLLFLRWAATAQGVLEHLESGDVAWGRTPEEARAAALELTLYELKAELDAAIRRRRAALEE